MISEAAENAVGRTQSRQDTNHLPFSSRVPSNVVAGQHDQVRFQSVRDRDTPANVVRGSEGTHVDVGKLGDTKALEGFGQTRQADALANHLHVLPAVEEPVAD